MKKLLAILSMLVLLGGQSSIALGQTRIFRGAATSTQVEGTTAEGAAFLPNPILIGGDDGTDITNILVDPEGHLQIDILTGGGGAEFAEDSPAIDLSLGSYPLTVRQDVDGSSSAGTDGDNAFLFSDSRGFLKTEIFTGGDTFDISAVSLPLPSGAATSALQLPDGHNVTVDNAAGASAVNIQDGGNSITVDGTFFQATQPVSVASLPLPSGAATEATLLTIDADTSLISAATHLEDVLHVSGDRGMFMLGVENEDQVVFIPGEGGDYGPIAINRQGSVFVATQPGLDPFTTTTSIFSITSSVRLLPGTTAVNLGKAESALHSDGDVGVGSLGVANLTLATRAGNGDYIYPAMSISGAVMSVLAHDTNISATIRATKADDEASNGGHVGVPAFSIRDDVLEANASVSTDLDYVFTRTDNFGSAWSALTADDGARIPANSTTGLKVNLGADNDVIVSGANSNAKINCNANAFLNMTAATTTQIVALSGSEDIFVCSYSIVSDGVTATDVKFVSGTGSDCAVSQADRSSDLPLTAAADTVGISRAAGEGMILKSEAGGDALCVTSSGAATIGVDISYAQF